VLEATAASLMAAAILATAGGMGWLVVSLPNRLQQLEAQITQILQNQQQVGREIQEIRKEVVELDRRTIRLELDQ
jgi:hypothetical protein